ncbi:hypothetical protein AYK21_04640 [Thermoplasmatales archaeon SG8-52-2]|nr:MAG: hypothetical protein AYK21_04640 [Thermoplasmatales archaeon SG8-52-2]
MNKFHFLSLVCLFLGIVFLFIGFILGDVEAGIFFIIPYISGSGLFGFFGFVFIIASTFLFLFGLTNFIENEINEPADSELKSRKKTSIKGGGVILFGPIPIIFGSSWKIAIISIILAIILIIVSFFSFRN